MTAEHFKRVDDKSLRERAVSNIRQAIVSGVLKPGERLVETAIAEQMGISRAPVREAIRLLEHEGFVVSFPRKGSFVIELTRADIEEIYTLRTALEGLAIKLALPYFTSEEIDKLDVMVEKMHQAAENQDMFQLVEWDHAFHNHIVQMSRNDRLLQAWLRMSAQMRLFFTMKDQLFDNLDDVVDTHYPILKALRRGDVDITEKIMNEHIIEAGELVLTSLNKEEDQE